jgi:hypothetical protein
MSEIPSFDQYIVKKPADVDISGLQEIVVDNNHDRFLDGHWHWKLKNGHDVYKSTSHYNGADLFLVTSTLPWVVRNQNPIKAGRLVVKKQKHDDGYSYDHYYIRPENH